LKVGQRRAKEVATLLSHFQRARHADGTERYGMGFLTLTVRHNRTERCATVKKRLLGAWRRVQATREFRSLSAAYGFVGDVRAMELKFSYGNGWHPHLHLITVLEVAPGGDAVTNAQAHRDFAELVVDLWLRELGSGAAARGQFFRMVVGVTGIKNYITKWSAAQELTKGSQKTTGGAGSMTPFQMLDRIARDRAAGRRVGFLTSRFREFVRAFDGARQITYSHGLRATRAALVEEMTDDQIAKSDVGSTVEVRLTERVFRAISRGGAQAEALNAYEFDGGTGALVLFLAGRGILSRYDERSNCLHLLGEKAPPPEPAPEEREAALQAYARSLADQQAIAWASIRSYRPN